MNGAIGIPVAAATTSASARMAAAPRKSPVHEVARPSGARWMGSWVRAPDERTTSTCLVNIVRISSSSQMAAATPVATQPHRSTSCGGIVASSTAARFMAVTAAARSPVMSSAEPSRTRSMARGDPSGGGRAPAAREIVVTLTSSAANMAAPHAVR